MNDSALHQWAGSEPASGPRQGTAPWRLQGGGGATLGRDLGHSVSVRVRSGPEPGTEGQAAPAGAEMASRQTSNRATASARSPAASRTRRLQGAGGTSSPTTKAMSMSEAG